MNVDVESIMAQKAEKERLAKEAQERKKSFEKVGYDEKHYLDTFLVDNQTSKELVIRLLPFSPTNLSVFQEVSVHTHQINKGGKTSWKTVMCPVGNGKSDKCPFCEFAKEAKKAEYETTDEITRKKYNSMAFKSEAKSYWVVRCIDRAHEEDGPKFWRFPHAKNGKGIYDQIYSLFDTRRKRGTNIFDLYEGKDLIINVKREKNANGKETTTYLVADDDRIKPLADTEEQMEKWVNDPLSLDDVYPTKPYDYLNVLLKGDTPVFSKQLNTFIGKSDADKIAEEARIQEVQENLMPENKDFSTYTVNTGNTKTENAIAASMPQQVSNDTYDDIPF